MNHRTQFPLLLALALMPACNSSSSSGGDGGIDSGTDSDSETTSDSGWPGPGSDRCDGGVEVFQCSYPGCEITDVPSGIERCPDGSFHRYEVAPCAFEYQPSPCNPDFGGCVGDGPDGGCPEDMVCHDHPFGCFCMKPCMSDSDCAADEFCKCTIENSYGFMNFGQKCRPADCRSDEDCGAYRCGLDLERLCDKSKGARCHTAEDECEGPDQCPDWFCEIDSEWKEPRCEYDEPVARWECRSFDDTCE